LAQAPTSSSENSAAHTREHPSKPWENTYTFSQPLPDLRESHALPKWGAQPFSYSKTPPNLIPWTPRFLPEEWVYTDGSDIKGHPKLGAAVIHTPTRTTIYIDATGCEETRTITRTELVPIHTALSRFEDHPWLGIFTDSLSSIHANRLHYYKPGLTTAPRYHHHMIPLQSISDLLETRREKGYSTSLHNIRAHTNVRGNDLADAAAKLAVTDFDTLPDDQNARIEIGATTARPPFWVMYTINPPSPTPALAT